MHILITGGAGFFGMHFALKNSSHHLGKPHGQQADTDCEAIIRDYIRESPEAIKLKISP